MKRLREYALVLFSVLVIFPTSSQSTTVNIELFQQAITFTPAYLSNQFQLIGSGTVTAFGALNTNTFITPVSSGKIVSMPECEEDQKFSWNDSQHSLSNDHDAANGGTALGIEYRLCHGIQQPITNLFLSMGQSHHTFTRYVTQNEDTLNFGSQIALSLNLYDAHWIPGPQQGIFQNPRKSPYRIMLQPNYFPLSRLLLALLMEGEFPNAEPTSIFDDLFYVDPQSSIFLCIFIKDGQRRLMILITTPDGSEFMAILSIPDVAPTTSDSSSQSSSGRNSPLDSRPRSRSSSGSGLLRFVLEKYQAVTGGRHYSIPGGKNYNYSQANCSFIIESEIEDMESQVIPLFLQ